LGSGGLVLVEDVHSRVFLHIMVSVEMVLQLIVGVESPLNVVDGADEAQDLVFHDWNTRPEYWTLENKKRALGQHLSALEEDWHVISDSETSLDRVRIGVF
jgi:hypothetical protein